MSGFDNGFADDAATLDIFAAVQDRLGEELATEPEALGPRIPVGDFLAVVTDVTQHENENTHSVGYFWDLTVSLGGVANGWTGPTETIRYYTYLGKRVNGAIEPAEKLFNLINILRALGATQGGIKADELKGRVIKVRIKHEPGRDNPDTLWAAVSKTYAWTDPVTGKTAPLLSEIHQGGPVEDLPF